MKVLFISQWYPNKFDSMFGLFVRKHAEAVSLYADTKVIYVCNDTSANSFQIERSSKSALDEIIIYYPYAQNGGFWQKIMNGINYLRAYRIGFDEMKKGNWKPDIVQANIFTRTALIAYFYGLKNKIPYAVIEHWTRYFRPQTFRNFCHRWITKWTVKKASAVLPVTKHLQRNMEKHALLNDNYQIINNVCEDDFFVKTETVKNEVAKILNVTCFTDDHKNLSGILRVVKRLSEKRDDFVLYLIGDGEDFLKIKNYANELEIDPKLIVFTGLLEGKQLISEFQTCDFTILFSNYENIPVVISESLACGKPVISTSVGGINEHIDKSNGILIDAKDEDALVKSISYMIDNYKNYDSETIRQNALKKYSYRAVGEHLTSIYRAVLNIKLD